MTQVQNIIRRESPVSDLVNCTCGNDVCCDGFDMVQSNGTPATPDLGEYWDGSLQCGTCKVIMVPAEAVLA